MSLINGFVRLFVILLVPCLVYTLRAGVAQPQQLSLSSGNQVSLLSESRSGQTDAASLLVRYQSGVSFDLTTAALGQEADQVFAVVEKRSSASGCNQIVLNVNEAPQGILSTSRNRSFIFDRDAKGNWQRETSPDAQE